MEFLSNLRETAKAAQASIGQGESNRRSEGKRIQAENERLARERRAANIRSCTEKLKNTAILAEFKAYLLDHAQNTGELPKEWPVHYRWRGTTDTFFDNFDFEDVTSPRDELIPSIERVVSEDKALEGISISVRSFEGYTRAYFSETERRPSPFKAQFLISYSR